MIESRGKYGLTNAIDTCKIGSFLPFSMVHTTILNSCVAAAGDAGAARQQELLETPNSWNNQPA